jgi:hypothetical protein
MAVQPSQKTPISSDPPWQDAEAPELAGASASRSQTETATVRLYSVKVEYAQTGRGQAGLAASAHVQGSNSADGQNATSHSG